MMKKIAIAATSAMLITGLAHAASDQPNLQHMQTQINQLKTDLAHVNHTNAHGLLSTNAHLSHMMLSQQHGVGSELSLLKARQHGTVSNGVTLGGSLQADALYQHANNKTHINPSLKSASKSASRINLTNVDLQFIAAITHWATGYVNFEHIMTGEGHANVFNKAYLLIGNLQQSPFYGLIGRNDIDFGQFASVNPYSIPVNREFFQANGEVAEVGFDDYGFNAVISAMNGGHHDSIVYQSNVALGQNLYTPTTNNITNFALNLGYGFGLAHNTHIHLGAGFLRGSIFSTSSHGINPAWDVNTMLNFDNFELLGEYTRTFRKSNKHVSGADVAKLNKHASAWQVAGEYHFPLMGHKTTFSASYSALRHDGLTDQYAAGLRSDVLKHINTGIEYAYERDGSTRNNTITLDVTAMF